MTAEEALVHFLPPSCDQCSCQQTIVSSGFLFPLLIFFPFFLFPAVSQILRKMRMWMWRKRVTLWWSAVDTPSGSRSRTAAMPFLQHPQCLLTRGRVWPESSKCLRHPTRHIGESHLLVLMSKASLQLMGFLIFYWVFPKKQPVGVGKDVFLLGSIPGW